MTVVASRSWHFKTPNVIPGFGLTFGFTVSHLAFIVLLPLAALIIDASAMGFSGLWATMTESRVAAALRTTFGLSLGAALVDMVCGALVAWVLTRHRFPGRRLLDALVDLPFALPTAVAGIALATLYAPNGWLGAPLASVGIAVASTKLGIFLALVFVGLPFVVRTVQPLIAELPCELEEASATLGASRAQTAWRVLVPPLIPALLSGLAMAFARAVGEYGSVIFIAGNLAYVTEIAPLLIYIKLEEQDYVGATGIGTIMLIISFAMILVINAIQSWSRRRYGNV